MAALPTHGLFQNLTGTEFGRLTVLLYLGRRGRNNTWLCRCSCGQECEVAGGNLKSGHTQSCGCLHKEKTSEACSTHRKTATEEYQAWAHMKSRCYNKLVRNYHRYGGRGIIVCDRWLDSFENFLMDMGAKPSTKHSIDRRDNNGNYEPSNCRWATDQEQANNRSTNHLITIDGKTQTIQQWADEYGLHCSVIISRDLKGIEGLELIAPSVKRGTFITFNGITDTYSGWSKRIGISEDTISQRIRRNGWSVEQTLTKGV